MRSNMMLLVLLAWPCTSIHGQLVLDWHQAYNSLANDIDSLGSVATDGAGNLYVVGRTRAGTPLQSDILVLKYDAFGTLLWEQFFDGAAHADDLPFAIASGRHEELVITGTSSRETDLDSELLILKYAPNGDLLWSRTQNNSPLFYDAGKCVALDHEQNVIVGGNTQIEASPATQTLVLTKYTGGGDSVGYFVMYPAFSYPCPITAMDLDMSGDIYPVMSHLDEQSRMHWCSSIHAAAPWSQFFTSSDVSSWWKDPADAIVDDLGWLVSVGSRRMDVDSTSDDILIMRKDTMAIYDVEIQFDGGGMDRGLCVREDASNNIYVAGYVTDINGLTAKDAVLLKYDHDGNLIWSRVRAGSGLYDDVPTGLAVMPDGRAFVCGHFGDGGAPAFGVWAVSADGTLDWNDVYTGTGDLAGAEDIALYNEECVVVTGFARSNGDPASMDAITRMYCSGPLGIEQPSGSKPTVAFDPYGDQITLVWPQHTGERFQYDMMDGTGRLVATGQGIVGARCPVEQAGAGIYLLRCWIEAERPFTLRSVELRQ